MYVCDYATDGSKVVSACCPLVAVLTLTRKLHDLPYYHRSLLLIYTPETRWDGGEGGEREGKGGQASNARSLFCVC